MTEDPYRLDDDLQLSSIDSDFDDEYDGLETDLDQEPRRGMRKMPIVLGMMLVVFVSGAAFIAYQMFVADVGPIVPAQPPMAVAQQQAQPPFTGDDSMPPVLDQAGMAQDNAQQGDFTPPADDFMPPIADQAPVLGEAPMPVVEEGFDDNATTAEALLPPALDGQSDEGDVAASEAVADVTAEHDAMADFNPQQVDAQSVAEEPVTEVSAEVAPTETAPMESAPMESAQVEPVTEASFAEEQQAAEQASIEQPMEEPSMEEHVAEAPAEALLQPIDTASAINDDSAEESVNIPEPVVANAAANLVEKAKPVAREAARQATRQANQAMDEVQKILQGAGVVEPAAKAPAMPAPPVEVTPRAREVIVVTRTYGAQTPQAAIAAGERVMQAHQYETAAEIFDNQLRQNPSDPLALAGKAMALQRAGNDVEAMNTYERLISLNPRDVEAMTNYLGLLQTQDPQQALVRLQNLSQQYPDNAAVAGQLGMLHARMMDTPNAIRYFQSAAALDATNATYPFNLAVLYDRLGSQTKARDEYRRALVLARDYPSRAEVSIDVIRQRLHALR